MWSILSNCTPNPPWGNGQLGEGIPARGTCPTLRPAEARDDTPNGTGNHRNRGWLVMTVTDESWLSWLPPAVRCQRVSLSYRTRRRLVGQRMRVSGKVAPRSLQRDGERRRHQHPLVSDGAPHGNRERQRQAAVGHHAAKVQQGRAVIRKKRRKEGEELHQIRNYSSGKRSFRKNQQAQD